MNQISNIMESKMKYREFAITVQGHQACGCIWEPSGKPQGVISLVHGLGEHSKRYAPLAELFGNYGFSLTALDLWGHGRSPGKRGHIRDYEFTLDLVDALLTEAQNLYPTLPQFIYGHSMGGNIVLNHLARRQPKIAGGIVTGPWLRLVNPLPPVIMPIIHLLSTLHPTFTQSNGLDSSNLSEDKTVVDAYEKDPLVHDRISVRTVSHLHKAADWIMKNGEQIKVPLLLMHGGADHITAPQASEELSLLIGEHCTCKIWDGLNHEIHNETHRAEVIAYINTWLQAMCIDTKQD